MNNGQFQVYTGLGKGKTTAAIGLSIRAAGRGYQVYIGQFVKDMEYGEISILKDIENINVELLGTGQGCLIDRELNDTDIEYGQIAINKILLAMKEYDVVIADEINVACLMGIVKEQDLLKIIEAKPKNVELIFTGIEATEKVLERADLITNMKCERHYYKEKGLTSRKGIEL